MALSQLRARRIGTQGVACRELPNALTAEIGGRRVR